MPKARRTVVLVASAMAALLLAAGAALVGTGEPAHATFPGENGKIAFSSSEGSIYTMDPDGSDLKRIPIDLPGVRFGQPAFSPDGSRLAFVGSADGCVDVYATDADGSGLENVTGGIMPDPCQHVYEDPAWSPDGEEVAFGVDEDDSYVRVADTDGSGVRRLGGIFTYSAPNGIAWSPDGSEVAVGMRNTDGDYPPAAAVYALAADGSGEGRIFDAGLDSEGEPSFSPDGSRLAFVGCAEWEYLESYACPSRGIYVAGKDGSGATRLAGIPLPVGAWPEEHSPAWSPDGSRIAFSSENGDVFTVPPDGSGEAEPIANQPSSSGLHPRDLDWGPADEVAPAVTGVRPAPGATGVAPHANVSATFSEAMTASSVSRHTVKLYRKGASTPVGAKVSYDAATRRAVVNPTNNLRMGATYRASVSTGAKDISGNALDQDPSLAGDQPKVWRFTVKR